MSRIGERRASCDDFARLEDERIPYSCTDSAASKEQYYRARDVHTHTYSVMISRPVSRASEFGSGFVNRYVERL